MSEIEAIRERWAQVTPGPWEWDGYSTVCCPALEGPEETLIEEWKAAGSPKSEHGRWPQEWHNRALAVESTICWVRTSYGDIPQGRQRADIAAIAAAPTDIATLLAEIGRLRKLEAEVWAAKNGWQRLAEQAERERDEARTEVERLRAALKEFANRAAWEPVGDDLWFWSVTGEHPADIADKALGPADGEGE